MQIKNILGYMLGISSRLVKRKMDCRIEQYGLTTSQWALINLLHEKGALSQKQIADELLSDKATIGEVVKSWKEKSIFKDKVLVQTNVLILWILLIRQLLLLRVLKWIQ